MTDANVRALAKPARPWKEFLEPWSYVGLSYGLDLSPRTLLLASATSIGQHLGIPELVLEDTGDPYWDLLPPGTQHLKQRHLATLLPLTREMIEDAKREDEMAARGTEIARLRAENDQLRAAKQPRTPRPPAAPRS